MSADRLQLARADLADQRLEGIVRAERFAEAHEHVCRVAVTAIRLTPDRHATQEDQLLHGERFDVLDAGGEWSWGQARRDGYVGYVRTADLAAPGGAPSHWVSALSTIVFERADFRAPALSFLSLNSLVTPVAEDGRFLRLDDGGWVFGEHLRPIGETEDSPADVAERFLHAPYQWGGRESRGVDCSGLVQQALYACGLGCPRDSGDQAHIGREIGRDDLRRGDLVFWAGHVGMMLDEARLIHANSHGMSVQIEPLERVIERVRRAGVGGPTGFRRYPA